MDRRRCGSEVACGSRNLGGWNLGGGIGFCQVRNMEQGSRNVMGKGEGEHERGWHGEHTWFRVVGRERA